MNDLCQFCDKYLVQYELYGFLACVHCFYGKQFEFLNKQVEKYQSKMLQLDSAYKEVIQIQEAKSILGRAYCPNCQQKTRDLSKDEIVSVIDSLDSSVAKGYFKKLIKEHLKEKSTRKKLS